MISLLAAAVLAAQPAPPIGKTAWVLASVDHSEWCPEGLVRLDLTNGEYALTSGADRRVCQDRGLERPTIKGKLTGQALADLRAAYARSLAEGLESEACRTGKPHDVFVINGGPYILLVTHGRGTLAPPNELGCWSPAADALHRLLRDTFQARRR